MIPTRSASVAASCMSWVVRISVTPRSRSSRSRSQTNSRAAGSSPVRRLVEEQHLRLVHQRPRDHHALRLPAREQVGLDVAALAQPELLEQLVGPRGRLGGRHAVVGGVKGQVAADRHRAVEVAALGDDREHAPGPHRVGADVDAADHRPAAGGLHARGQHPDRGRLAGAVRAEQAEHLAGLDRERDPVDRVDRRLRVALDEVRRPRPRTCRSVVIADGSPTHPAQINDGGDNASATMVPRPAESRPTAVSSPPARAGSSSTRATRSGSTDDFGAYTRFEGRGVASRSSASTSACWPPGSPPATTTARTTRRTSWCSPASACC